MNKLSLLPYMEEVYHRKLVELLPHNWKLQHIDTDRQNITTIETKKTIAAITPLNDCCYYFLFAAIFAE